jgi:hypothetical protein
MDLTPIPVTVGAARVPDRCIVRGQRLVQVKFVALPLEQGIGERRIFTRRNPFIDFIHRVIGRLVAARP